MRAGRRWCVPAADLGGLRLLEGTRVEGPVLRQDTRRDLAIAVVARAATSMTSAPARSAARAPRDVLVVDTRGAVLPVSGPFVFVRLSS
jgi:hypothetical protein